MKKSIYVILLTVLFGAGVFAQQADQRKYESLWEGKLKISGVTLRLVLKIFKNNDGSLGAVLNSPDQTKQDLSVSFISLTNDSLKFESKMLMASYAGQIKKDSIISVGKFTQRGVAVDLLLKKVEKLTEVARPQAPHKPYPYNEEEVTFDNKDAGITLAGTFTFPKTGGPFTTVVLVTGSGPQDRDETIFNHKPFLVIADYLTRRGVAVLRYDDRGIGQSKGNFSEATTADFTTDALAAVNYLMTRKDVNKDKIGIAGHSEGGAIAEMAAAVSDNVKFIIMLAGPGTTGEEVLLTQTKLITKSEGGSEEQVEKAYNQNHEIYNIIINEPDSTKAAHKIEALLKDFYSKSTDEEKKQMGADPTVFINNTVRQITSPWFRFFIKFDPQKYLGNIHVPVLALNGDKDLQVYYKDNLAGIAKGLKSAGDNNFKTIAMPGLNHLFQKIKKGTISEYGQLEETFSPEALKVIGDWIIDTMK